MYLSPRADCCSFLPTCLPAFLPTGLPVLLLLHTSVPHCLLAFIPTAFLQLPQQPQPTPSAPSKGKLIFTHPHPSHLPTSLPDSDLFANTGQPRRPHSRLSGSSPPPFLAGQVKVLGFGVHLTCNYPSEPWSSRLGTRPYLVQPYQFILSWRSGLRSPVPCPQRLGGFPRCPSRSRRRLDQEPRKTLGWFPRGGIGILALACLGGPISCWRCQLSPSCYHRPADRHLGSPSPRASLGFSSSASPFYTSLGYRLPT